MKRVPNKSYHNSLKLLKRANYLNQWDYLGLYYLGLYYMNNTDKTDDAVQFFIKSLDKNPVFHKPFCALGEIFMRNNDFDQALFYLRKGYSVDPDKAELLNLYGLSLFNVWKLDDAERILKKCIEADNSYYKAYNNLGNVYRRIDKYNEAISMYKKSIEASNKKHLAAYINLSSVYLSKKDLNSWIECLEDALETNSKDLKNAMQYNYVLNCYLGLHNQRLGNEQQAIGYLKRATHYSEAEADKREHLDGSRGKCYFRVRIRIVQRIIENLFELDVWFLWVSIIFEHGISLMTLILMKFG